MPVTKPDATVFDSADDSIATSRSELHQLAVSFNTIADEYNAGTLGGSGTDVVAGTNVEVTTPDSAGSSTITAYAPEHLTNLNSTINGTFNAFTEGPGHEVRVCTNSTGSAVTQNLTINTSFSDWESEGIAPGPSGTRNYVSFLTLKGAEDNNADCNVTIRVYDYETATFTNIHSALAISAGTVKFFRITVMGEDYFTDSAGECWAHVLCEDLTSSAQRIRILPV